MFALRHPEAGFPWCNGMFFMEGCANTRNMVSCTVSRQKIGSDVIRVNDQSIYRMVEYKKNKKQREAMMRIVLSVFFFICYEKSDFCRMYENP